MAAAGRTASSGIVVVMVRHVVAVLFGGWVSGACTGAGTFLCESDQQCADGSEGVCQPNGLCSFPADDCPSGQRYGQHSGPLSGECVEPDAGNTGGRTSTGEAGGVEASTTGGGGDATAPTTDVTGPVDPDTTMGVGDTADPTTGAPVDSDLVLWLELEGGRRPLVPDSSESMADGVCIDGTCPQPVPGAIGSAASFDGVDDVIVVSHVPAFETTEGLTVSVWLYLEALPTEFWALVTKPFGDGLGNSWELYFYPGSDGTAPLGFAVGTGMGFIEVAAPELPPVAEWVHVAATWDGAEATLWMAGRAVGGFEVPSLMFDDQAIFVGADDDHGPDLVGYFDGRLDDVRVYRRALGADEIAALAMMP